MTFRRCIRDNPDDDTVRLAYADWLDERGDSNGVMIRKMVCGERLGLVQVGLGDGNYQTRGYFTEPDNLIRRVLLACGRYNSGLNPEEVACPKRITSYEPSLDSEVVTYVGEGAASSQLIYRRGLIDEACLPYPVWGEFGPRLFAEQPIRKIRVLGLSPYRVPRLYDGVHVRDTFCWFTGASESLIATGNEFYLPKEWFSRLSRCFDDHVQSGFILQYVTYGDGEDASVAIGDLEGAVADWCRSERDANGW